MKEYYGQILIQYRPQLVEEIEPLELLNQLISKNVLTKRQAKSIQCMQDPYKQNEAILDALHRRPDEDFDKFCEALNATNQMAIVNQYLKPASPTAGTPTTTGKKNIDELSEFGIAVRVSTEDVGISDTKGTEWLNLRPHVVQQESVGQELPSLSPSRTEGEHAQPDEYQPSDSSDEDWKQSNGPTFIKRITVKKCSDEFYDANVDQAYAMNKRCRGKCLLICNHAFTTRSDKIERQNERYGADRDVENLKQLFTELHFDVDCRLNLTAEQMLLAVREVASHESMTACNCFVMCVMSHGKLSEDDKCVEVILGSDNFPIATSNLLAPFTTEQCPGLRGKPRIVLFQACRGAKVDKTESDCISEPPSSASLVETDASLDHSVPDHSLNLKDFIIGYPTQSGYRSYRNTIIGSWYINALTRVFCERACDTDVATMLRIVNTYISKWVSQCDNPDLNGCQTGSISDNLTKHYLYLFPGVFRDESI